jgi:hypothetical protein
MLKRLIALMILLTFFTLGVHMMAGVVHANNSVTIPFGHNVEGVKHLPAVGLTDTTSSTGVQTSVGSGAAGFESLLRVLGNFLNLTLGSVAVLALFVAGYQLVTAQSAATEEMEKQKMNIVYILMGLIVFALSGTFVYDFLFSDQGAYLDVREGETAALALADKTVREIRRLLNLFLSFSGAGAILMLIIASIRLVINPGSDEQIEKQKKLVAYTALGIIIIGLSDTVVNQIVFPIDRATGELQGVNVSLLELQLQGLSNYVLGFVGVFVFVTFVISGVVLVVNMGNEEINTKVKTSMKHSIIGVLVVYSAYTVVVTLLRTFLAAENGV